LVSPLLLELVEGTKSLSLMRLMKSRVVKKKDLFIIFVLSNPIQTVKKSENINTINNNILKNLINKYYKSSELEFLKSIQSI
jgi:homoaconitase/3-isopropylmalate dehydratase large subunit